MKSTEYRGMNDEQLDLALKDLVNSSAKPQQASAIPSS